MANIIVNQSSYAGRNIIINGNKVIIDGIDVTPDAKEVIITVNGDIDSLKVDYCKDIVITGNVNDIKSGSGDIQCGDIKNNASTGSGDIEANKIEGNIQTGSGDVKAAYIGGSVKTGSGNIKYLK